MTDITTTLEVVKEFVLDQFLPGEDPAALAPDTELISTGIIDSLATLKLVAFLEENFGIHIEAKEVNPVTLNTLASISSLVESKLNPQ